MHSRQIHNKHKYIPCVLHEVYMQCKTRQNQTSHRKAITVKNGAPDFLAGTTGSVIHHPAITCPWLFSLFCSADECIRHQFQGLFVHSKGGGEVPVLYTMLIIKHGMKDTKEPITHWSLVLQSSSSKIGHVNWLGRWGIPCLPCHSQWHYPITGICELLHREQSR